MRGGGGSSSSKYKFLLEYVARSIFNIVENGDTDKMSMKDKFNKAFANVLHKLKNPGVSSA